MFLQLLQYVEPGALGWVFGLSLVLAVAMVRFQEKVIPIPPSRLLGRIASFLTHSPIKMHSQASLLTIPLLFVLITIHRDLLRVRQFDSRGTR